MIDELDLAILKPGVSDRFWKYVSKDGPNGCWPWTGSLSRRGGYGRIFIGGKVRMGCAHRVSWILHFGPIPDGLKVLHHCDNPPCCNPTHFFLGTQADNMKDCSDKGRFTDRRNKTAKLSVCDVMYIRNLYRAGRSFQKLADSFGVDYVTLRKAAMGVYWSDLNQDCPPITPRPRGYHTATLDG